LKRERRTPRIECWVPREYQSGAETIRGLTVVVNCCNRQYNFLEFCYNIFKLAVSTDPSKGNIQGTDSCSVRSVTLYYLNSRKVTCLTPFTCSFSSIFLSPPYQRSRPLQGKPNENTFPQTMCTCSQLPTAVSKRIQTLYGKERRQHSIHIAKKVQVCQPKHNNLPSPFNTNQPMLDYRFIFSSL
jgi:hypothetical protein